MNRTVYLYDAPEDLARFLPFTQSRPIGELRYGARLLRERWETTWSGRVAGHIAGAHLQRFTEPGAPPVVAAVPGQGEHWCFRSTLVPRPGMDIPVDPEKGPHRFRTREGDDVGCYLPSGTPWPGTRFPDAWPAVTVDATPLRGIWQIISELHAALEADLSFELTHGAGGRVPAACTVLGDPDDLLVDDGAIVEPMVVFDTRSGPVWVQESAEIRTFSRLAGPLVVGPGARIVGGQVRESSIGPLCVVHGEVSNTIFLGYANKAHDGFVGHSIVGRWVNLGAGTITSNLKNTYGHIRLDLGGERVETGMQFLGALVGDHVKTAIGTMLPTGCVIGTGANLFGTRRPEPQVPPFAWGTDEPDRRVACRMFLQTAAKVLPRRDVVFDETVRRYLESVWTHTTGRTCD